MRAQKRADGMPAPMRRQVLVVAGRVMLVIAGASLLAAALIGARLLTIGGQGHLTTAQSPESADSATPSGIPAAISGTVRSPAGAPCIGIVAGHWQSDSGSVCANGTTEAQVNLTIANLVQQKLTARGYQVDLLQEFDPRLTGYKAAALVSIHNDSCDYINDQATGFKIAGAVSSRDPNLTGRLTACLRDRYQRITGLPFHPGSITTDMTEYHAFGEIDPTTTAAIIETGFLNLDYNILTKRPDLVADGIVAGVLCYINTESVAATPMPTPLP